MNIIKRIIPLTLFAIVMLLLWRGLSLHPTKYPLRLSTNLRLLFNYQIYLIKRKMVTNHDFLGHVTILNVWATWCEACAEEHSALLQLAQEEHLILFGLDYKDDSSAAKKWLDENGNPFQLVAVDATGNASIDWGVYGTPETFVIDKKGIIRFKQLGPITRDAWLNDLQPLIQKLEQEHA